MVQVSNAPEGRTYITSRKLESFFDDERNKWSSRTVEQTSVVPNGKWVMERPGGYAWLIGDHDAVDDLRFIDVHGTDHILYVSDQPFGWIVCDEEDVNKSVYPPIPGGRRRLHYARQIHKGELGQGPAIERLPYVRQAYEGSQKLSVVKARERRRSNYGWVRLTDLVEATGLSNEDIIFGYWDYSGHRNYSGNGGVLLDIVRATSKDEVEGSVPTVFSLTQSETGELLGGWNGHRFYTGDVWVRRGFAFTVLRLQALGVQPYAMQLA